VALVSRPGFTTLQVSDETRRALRQLQNQRKRAFSWPSPPWSADGIIFELVSRELQGPDPKSQGPDPKSHSKADVGKAVANQRSLESHSSAGNATATDSETVSEGRSE
jgi:hypothetical protein